MRDAHATDRLAVAVAGSALLLCLLAWQGHLLEDRLPQLEQGVESLGAWGPAVYVVAVLLLAPLLVPDTLFGVVAGVAFGLGSGFAYYFSAVYLTSILGFLVSRHWLRGWMLAMLDGRPSIRRMAAAASREGPGLTFWIRLMPLNPLVVSYALGAFGVPFRSVAIGTLGMLPHMFLTVYLGVSAVHVTRMAVLHHAHWTAAGVAMMVGLVACTVLVLGMSRRAWSEIERAMAPVADPP